MEITDLTPTEQRIREAFLRGAAVDLREAPDDEAASGHSWGPDRTVRAEVLRWLLLGDHLRDGWTIGLWLTGARIVGRLHLAYGVVEHPVHLAACHFDEPLSLYGAQLRQLELNGSHLPALNAATVRIDGVLRMTGCRVTGSVALGGARIAGALFLDNAELGTATDGSGQQEDPVLQLNHAVLGTDVWGTGLVAHGQVRLLAAQIAGTLNFDDARIRHPGHTAVEAENLSVGADVRGMRLEVTGRVNLRGARIPGQLNLAYATLANPGGMALRASTAVIGELWLRDAAPIEGSVNLRRAQIDFLHAAPGVWPGAVRLDGLTYTTLAPHEPAERRLPLLARDEGGYVPYAYEQLSAAYRRMGDDRAARTVQLTRQRRHRTTLPWYGRLWGQVQDVTVGYGFRPVRAAVWLFSLLLAGSVAYALHHPHPLKAGEAPAFSPVFYTLDLLLPVIDFGQERAFTPDGWLQGLSYLLIITGWILATTIVAGITRAVSRQ
ncbi:membrane-associated oxidoreductase [Streptomyces beijiangensis]|uniref:Membrane-associated oxidoreductase n=1 Tax=Streptomyces beijiangensis TaxID=163361 RepID=A0A939F602_9ACTN|nr:membrane-associated oxidoreductase [Streptomyces beijiangensis]MBO0512692.1 membrane-associated oxidoreductase [Streptomyces beijiangensis]